MKKFADIVLKYRLAILILIMVVTAFFVYEMAARLRNGRSCLTGTITEGME